jgi:excisionase family DNA binding protein
MSTATADRGASEKPERLAYPVSEALELLPIGRTKMFELIATGELRTITIGRRRLIPADALAAFVAGAGSA